MLSENQLLQETLHLENLAEGEHIHLMASSFKNPFAQTDVPFKHVVCFMRLNLGHIKDFVNLAVVEFGENEVKEFLFGQALEEQKTNE